VDNGIARDARNRGVDTLSYFQVDNWAVKVADPLFIGYHVMRAAMMSSKTHRKDKPREAVGVHCLCDGVYRVIEYTVLDLYPQLLETDSAGTLIHYAGSPAIHILDVGFIESLNANYDNFPWWRAHKKIPCLNERGERIEPREPNGYKFETFIFDALRFVTHDPVVLENTLPSRPMKATTASSPRVNPCARCGVGGSNAPGFRSVAIPRTRSPSTSRSAPISRSANRSSSNAPKDTSTTRCLTSPSDRTDASRTADLATAAFRRSAFTPRLRQASRASDFVSQGPGTPP